MRALLILVAAGILGFVFAAPPVRAQNAGEEPPGRVSGYVEVVALGISDRSNSGPGYTGGDSGKRIDAIDEVPSQTTVIPFMRFKLEYHKPKSPSTWYFGNDDPTSFQAGFKRATPQGQWDVGLVGTLPSKVWENPFLVGVDRRATTRNDLAFSLGFARPLTDSTMWTAGYRLTSTSISSDTTPAIHPDLGREGHGHTLSGGYRWGTDSIELSYNRFSADGRADSHRDLALTYNTFRSLTNRLMLIGSVSLGRTRYDAVHPVFAKTREETVGNVLAIFMVNNFLGNPKRYAVFGWYAGTKQSNLEFFDSQLGILFVGVGWRF